MRLEKFTAWFYPYIVNWCNENGIQIVDGTKIKDTKVDISKVDEFIKALKILWMLEIIKRAFIHAVKKNRCLLLSLSGKSLIVYLLTRFNQLRIKNKILIISTNNITSRTIV